MLQGCAGGTCPVKHTEAFKQLIAVVLRRMHPVSIRAVPETELMQIVSITVFLAVEVIIPATVYTME